MPGFKRRREACASKIYPNHAKTEKESRTRRKDTGIYRPIGKSIDET
jgi:hypothetical protein